MPSPSQDDCRACGSVRLISLSAKVSDLCLIRSSKKQYIGSLPDALPIGSGDYVEFTFCMHCGTIQHDFPFKPHPLE